MQGYLTLATGKPLYFDAAVNLALSVKLNDPLRPISLLCDDKGKVSEAYQSYFDHIIELPEHAVYHGCGDKIRMPLYSPYDETMFIDGDCYIAKPDMDRHWKRMAAAGFWGMPGARVASGSWYGKQITDIMSVEAVPHVVMMNSGVFYFRKADALVPFVKEAMTIAEAETSILHVGHKGLEKQLADEPIWGVLMARHGIEPVGYEAEEGSISVTTYLSKNIRVDVMSGVSEMQKSKGYYVLNRLFSKGKVQHSPSVPHFVAFKPKRLYSNVANSLRKTYDLPLFSFD